MNAMEVIGSAIGLMADVNSDSETTKSVEIITFIGSSASLSMALSVWWKEDAHTYYIDSLSIVQDPSYTAKAAADYAKYQEDIQEGQTEMGAQNNILESNKSVLKTLGNSMDQVYSIMQGPIQLAKATDKAILIMGN